MHASRNPVTLRIDLSLSSIYCTWQAYSNPTKIVQHVEHIHTTVVLILGNQPELNRLAKSFLFFLYDLFVSQCL